MSKKISPALLSIAAVAGIVILWLINLNQKKDRTIKEMKRHNDDILEFLRSSSTIDNETKQQLEQLIETYEVQDSGVCSELINIMGLLTSGYSTNAVLSLVKVIEKLLKEKYCALPDFSDFMKEMYNGKKKSPVLHDYIEFGKKQEDLTQEEYHFMKGLKSIRNQEAHEVGVGMKIASNIIKSAASIGVGLIVKFSFEKAGGTA